jgi:TRAP-type C4-dicarboxylate transport system substrate-binding protein
MSFGELYLALSQNLVDGQENPLPTIQAGKFNEVQKYLVLTGHIITPRLVVINEGFWKGLSAADQKIVKDALDEAIAWQNAEIQKAEASLVDTFKKGGVTVIEPDIAAFRKATLDAVPPKFAKVWGEGTWEKIQAVK